MFSFWQSKFLFWTCGFLIEGFSIYFRHLVNMFSKEMRS
jgi:hypothetical protein